MTATAQTKDGLVITTTGRMSELFMVICTFCYENELDPEMDLLGHLESVSGRFDVDRGEDATTITYSRPERDFWMYDALGQWSDRDEWLEALYQTQRKLQVSKK
ncbi:MAG: hypothetical protein IID41_07220, partial [Planctomycetes bacterium]|nr:hypothetical protein [Planctomycetota bacterium]